MCCQNCVNTLLLLLPQVIHCLSEDCAISDGMYERGILGKRVFILSPDSPIIESMDKGFYYFKSWADERLSKGIDNCDFYSLCIY